MAMPSPRHASACLRGVLEAVPAKPQGRAVIRQDRCATGMHRLGSGYRRLHQAILKLLQAGTGIGPPVSCRMSARAVLPAVTGLRGSVEQVRGQAEGDQLLVGLGAQLAHRADLLGADGFAAAIQSLGDVAHTLAIGKQPDDFELARRQQ